MPARKIIMASNSLGHIFKITTWGESHGKAIGVVIDGCPAGLEISDDEINAALSLRAPGKNAYTSPRSEKDHAEILSGVFEGKTTGAPISIIIPNKDADPSKYEPIKDLLRPGHANYTYLKKYGIFDYRGGGRASARETACRVAAGTIAKKFLAHYGIKLMAYIRQIGSVTADIATDTIETLHQKTYQSPVHCPDPQATQSMMSLIEKAKSENDSLGGIVEFIALSVPAGIGDPVYEKLEANLAHAMMTLPASKGFEIGSGFQSVSMQGSEHNDLFIHTSGKVQTETNFAGGILGGISTSMPIVGRVVFKPTSSIQKAQKTLTISNETTSFELPAGSRHDPCVAIRAVPIVEAMAALVLADSILLNRCARL
jgi:chorismate synthase